MNLNKMIIQLRFHATYFESIYANVAAAEMKEIVLALQAGQILRETIEKFDNAEELYTAAEFWDSVVGKDE